MALANEVLVGRPNAVLHKLYSMKEGAPSPQLSPEIQPVIVLEADRPEWAFLGGVRRGAATASFSSSAAAKYCQLSVVNPVNSGIIAIVTYASLMNSAHVPTLECRIGCTVGAATPAAARALDLRFGNQSLACNVFVEEVAAVTGTVAYRVRGPANTTLYFPLTIILGPGNSIFFIDTVASAAAAEINQLSVAIEERPLEPSETR